MSPDAPELHGRITTLLEQTALAAILAEEGPELDALRGPLRDLVRLLASLGDAKAPAVRTAVIQGLDALDADDRGALNDALAQASTLWERLLADVRAAAAAQEADELEALRADPDLAQMFIAEALDHLGTIETHALSLESTPEDPQLLNAVFRPFHTIKGNAGALGVGSVQQLAHKVESLLDLARSGKRRITRADIDLVLRAVDVLGGVLRDLSLRLAGETVPDRSADRQRLAADIHALVQPAARTSGESREVVFQERRSDRRGRGGDPTQPARRHDDGAGWVKVDTRKLDNLVDMVGELVIVQSLIHEDPSLLRAVDDRLARNLAQLKRITGDLQRTAMSMRMVPLRQTFQKMGRLVRDLGRNSGKAVEFVMSGEDTELDRRVVEDINDPLMHMVRNSMDHGIEPAEARERAGKPASGRLSLTAFHQGSNIVIAIEDDGAGLNTERIRARAVAQGLLGRDATLTPAEIHQFIFKAGFSTADRVTEISGRGVGMDVVRRNIEALRGRIDIHSEPGRGTRFQIKLPLTLAIVEGLLLGVGTQRFVLPTFSVSESLRPLASQVHRVGGVPRMISVRDQLLPLVMLADLFRIPSAVQDPTEATIVVIEESGRRVALQVDRLLGKQEVVIKSLGAGLGEVRGVSGGAILGDGRIGLILDAQGLVSLKDDGAAAA